MLFRSYLNRAGVARLRRREACQSQWHDNFRLSLVWSWDYRFFEDLASAAHLAAVAAHLAAIAAHFAAFAVAARSAAIAAHLAAIAAHLAALAAHLAAAPAEPPLTESFLTSALLAAIALSPFANEGGEYSD